MGTSTVNAQKAIAYLRIDHDYESVLIDDLLGAAETYIRNICVPYVDENGEWDYLPPDLEQAVLFLVSHWYDNRGYIDTTSEMPFTVSALIANHRDWENEEE